jgi:hypothetical protein
VVANGGYREHPSVGGGRTILKSDTFTSDICFIDSAHGTLMERQDLKRNALVSMRHLAVGASGRVLVGGQGTADTADED